MGGEVAHAVSGGGPLGERLGHFFQGIGLQILEGYGLTETTAPVTVNTPELIKIGTVGAPMPGNAVKIADDGEILAKGVCVMRGYYKREDLSGESFADGWFRTGDIGQLDDEGFLTITGRKKEIIVTASGKNVVPALLEDQIRADALVSQVLVVGDNRPVHRRTGHPGRGGPARLAAPPRAAGLHHPRRGGGQSGGQGRGAGAHQRTPTSPCPRPRPSSPSGSCRPTSPKRPAT